MAVIVENKPRGISASSVVEAASKLIKKNYSLFLLTGAIVTLPSFFVDIICPDNLIADIVAYVLIAPVEIAALTIAAYKTLLGRNMSCGECLAAAIFYYIPVLVVEFILIGFIALGLVFFIVPGIIASCALAVTLQVFILENKGFIESIKRSCELTYGFRLKLLWIGLTLFLVSLVIFLLHIILAGVLIL